MGILDGIVEWIATQVMNMLDMINTSVLGALGCDMETFLMYFPAAETFYSIIVALAIGLLLLNLVFQLFRNFGVSSGGEAENPVSLTIRTCIFLFLAFCKRYFRYYLRYWRNALCVADDRRTATTGFCGFQFCIAYCTRGFIKRFHCTDCFDITGDSRMELYSTAI